MTNNAKKAKELFESLGAENLAMSLRNEHPQTMALILCLLSPKKAADVLRLLPEAFHSELLLRMSCMDEVPAVMFDLLANAAERFKKSEALMEEPVGGPAFVAEMSKNLDPESREEILGNLEERDPDLSEQIRQLMFSWEDLLSLDESAKKLIAKNVKASTWKIALFDCETSVCSQILELMPPKKRIQIKGFFDKATKKVPRHESEAARSEIVGIAARLLTPED